jgi:hypothetical protein
MSLGDVDLARLDEQIFGFAKALLFLTRDPRELSDGLAQVNAIGTIVLDLAVGVAFTGK